jgi:predicted RNase H-like HicB family nuclease
MSRPNYRVVLSFDGERKVFTARIPELPHCTGEGATRGEAIARIEEDLDAQLASFAERGTRPPSALDDAQFTGELKVKVSVGLQRELTWQSHNEGVDVNQLAAELLSSGLEQRRAAGRGPRQRGGNDNIGNSISHDAPRGRDFADRNRGGGPRFHDMLEDRAAFVDYVRKLESDGGRPRNDRPHGDNRPQRPQGDNRGPQGDNRGPQGDNRGPQGGHGGYQGGPQGGDRNDNRGGGGRRFGGRDNRGGGPRRGPEGGRDAGPSGGDGGGGGGRPHSPSESET